MCSAAIQEDVLTAVEALLVSLYGRHPHGETQAEKGLGHEMFPSPASPWHTDPSQLVNERSDERDQSLAICSDDLPTDAPEHSGAPPFAAMSTDASVKRQMSNSSSSSSVAEDWVINHILEPNVSQDDDEMTQSSTQIIEMVSAVKSSERLEDDAVSAADVSKGQLLAEDWSRGTALTNSSSGEPLQPVIIHQPPKHSHSERDKVSIQSSSNTKLLNAITEKRAALTAYDLISNCTMRAPLSPAALFEKEARAEILWEKPTASLQDISVTVHERWKHLGEEDRKK